MGRPLLIYASWILNAFTMQRRTICVRAHLTIEEKEGTTENRILIDARKRKLQNHLLKNSIYYYYSICDSTTSNKSCKKEFGIIALLFSLQFCIASFVTFTHCGKTAFLKIIQKCEQFVKNSSNCNYHEIDNVKTIQFDELFSNSNIAWKICQIATFISSVMWNPDNLTSYFQIPISPENSSNYEL